MADSCSDSDTISVEFRKALLSSREPGARLIS